MSNLQIVEKLCGMLDSAQAIIREQTELLTMRASALEITQEQADEPTAIATENDVDVLPDDIHSRIDRESSTYLTLFCLLLAKARF